MADPEKSMADSSFRNNATVCARQALDAKRTARQRLQSRLQSDTWRQLAIQDAENDRVRLAHLALRDGSK